MGRPPKTEGERRKSIGIMLEPGVISMLVDLSQWTGVSQNDCVNEAVKRYYRNRKKANS